MSVRPAALLLLAAALGLGLSAGDAAAQWKWRDGSGRITVSDLPPPRGIPERDILQRPSPTAPVVVPAPAAPGAPASAVAAAPNAESANPRLPASETPRTDPELEARRRAAEQQEAARKREEEARQAEARASNCQAARSQLAALESGQRMVRMNDKGEREFLDDQQRATATQRARSVIASECR